jgi:hypothetical protein
VSNPPHNTTSEQLLANISSSKLAREYASCESARPQHRNDNTATTTPQRQHRNDDTATTTPQRQHRNDDTATTTPQRRHRNDDTATSTAQKTK